MLRVAIVWLAALCCLVVADHHSRSTCNCNLASDRSKGNPAVLDQNLSQQDVAISSLEARYRAVIEQYEESLQRLSKAKSVTEQLADDVNRFSPSPCNREAGEVRCLSSGECISSLLVADGVEDCLDGTDESEEVTKVPFKVGDSFTGELLAGHNCFEEGYPSTVKAYIRRITFKDYFNQPDVETRITYDVRQNDGSTTERAFNLNGYYNTGNGKLYQLSADEDYNFGFNAQFGYFKAAKNPTVFFLGEIKKVLYLVTE
ncbi:unnamed protein product [Owenia fusiformis]|uniref:Annelid erythrocruorin linker subunit C-terminal domain-containing protein n=1 Tax=Owenia fusiformis TaxID=6347 RepID=A0A8S4P1Y8_OWEFU|nr:unnamed protein product [Owenia fusiformis]